MPPIKRWFPVSQDINADPEMWELRDKFGERVLAVWLQILSVSDRNEGLMKGTLGQWASNLMWVYSRGNPRWVSRDLEALQNALRAMSEKGWISLRSLSDGYQKPVREGSEDALVVVNYWKYHRTREPARLPPNPPNLPNLPNKKKIAPSHRNVTPPTPWPPDDLWLSELLKEQIFCSHCGDQLQDYQWWEFAATSLGGIDRTFIEKEFAKINAWWRENPTKRKTANGMKRFLRTWLEKAKNDQGRLYAVRRR